MNHKISVKSHEIKNIFRFAPREILFKFLVLGDFGVGKTSIIRRYTEGIYTENYKITIGAEFAIKNLKWDETTKINLQLWDIAGHERFGYLTRIYYKYAVAAAVVFDVSRIDTYNSVEKWLADLRTKVVLPSGKPVPVILLANKGDVANSALPVNEITELCKKYEILGWFITSAKDNSNIAGFAILISSPGYKPVEFLRYFAASNQSKGCTVKIEMERSSQKTKLKDKGAKKDLKDEAMNFLLKKVMENKVNEYNDKNDNILITQEEPIERKKKSACCG